MTLCLLRDLIQLQLHWVFGVEARVGLHTAEAWCMLMFCQQL